jgi:hypothetical protein
LRCEHDGYGEQEPNCQGRLDSARCAARDGAAQGHEGHEGRRDREHRELERVGRVVEFCGEVGTRRGDGHEDHACGPAANEECHAKAYGPDAPDGRRRPHEFIDDGEMMFRVTMAAATFETSL